MDNILIGQSQQKYSVPAVCKCLKFTQKRNASIENNQIELKWNELEGPRGTYDICLHIKKSLISLWRYLKSLISLLIYVQWDITCEENIRSLIMGAFYIFLYFILKGHFVFWFVFNTVTSFF